MHALIIPATSSNPLPAINQPASIFETLGDRFRLALTHVRLGEIFIHSQTARSREYLAQAAEDFKSSGAPLDYD